MNKIFYILLFTFISNFVYSQQHPVWQKVLPFPNGVWDYGGFGHDIRPADNGNFYLLQVVGDYTQILKVNPYGDTIWTRLIDSAWGYTGITTSNNDYIVVGCFHNYSMFCLKINSEGNIIWKKYYNIYPGALSKIIKTFKNEFVTVGYGAIEGVVGIIIKLDSIGNLLWEKKFYAPFSMAFESVLELENGGYLVCGKWSLGEGITHGVLIRVDNDGDSVWQKIDTSTFEYCTVNFINSEYLISSTFIDRSISLARICLIKTDTSGNKLFSKELNDTCRQHQQVGNLSVINPNKFIIAGQKEDTFILNQRFYSYVMLFDSTGNISKNVTLHPSPNSALITCFSINGNDFLFAGVSDYYHPDSSNNAYFVRTDSNFYLPPIGIKNINQEIPIKYYLYQNYPNPFNPSTKIKYDVPKNSNVTIKIYDLLGKEIYSFSEYKIPGTYELQFDDSRFASGVYFYRIQARQVGSSTRDFVAVKKMVLIK